MSYVKAVLLDKFILGPAVDWADAGETRYFEILETWENGDIMCRVDRYSKTFFTPAEIKAGKKIIEPNFSVPLGMKLSLEIVDELPKKWWQFWKSAPKYSEADNDN